MLHTLICMSYARNQQTKQVIKHRYWYRYRPNMFDKSPIHIIKLFCICFGKMKEYFLTFINQLYVCLYLDERCTLKNLIGIIKMLL